MWSSFALFRPMGVAGSIGLAAIHPVAAQMPEGDNLPRLIADVAFLPDDRAERLDIMVPPGEPPEGGWPIVVFVHGGGWGRGTRSDRVARGNMWALALHGYVCASTSYQLAPPVQPDERPDLLRNLRLAFPQNVQDVKSAVRYMRGHAADVQANPDRIALMGASAGAHLAVLAAFTGPDDGLEPGDDGLGEVSSRVRAVIALFGVYDYTVFEEVLRQDPDRLALARRASPLTYLDPGDPPVYAIHGTRDSVVPYTQTVALGAALRAAGVPRRVVIQRGLGHSFGLHLKAYDVKADVLAFLQEHLAAPPPAPDAPAP